VSGVAVNRRRKMFGAVAIFFSFAVALGAAAGESLPKIGRAPEFTLTNQDGKRLALKELRGKVLAITFIFASCTDTCPLLTAKMAGIPEPTQFCFRPSGIFSFNYCGSRA
jgi:protein SCO1